MPSLRPLLLPLSLLLLAACATKGESKAPPVASAHESAPHSVFVEGTSAPAAPDGGGEPAVFTEVLPEQEIVHLSAPAAGNAPLESPLATVAPPGGEADAESDADVLYPNKVRDPWEKYNRRMYKFNTKVDRYIARPMGLAYDKVVPDVVQHRVTSFFANLEEPKTMVSQLFQGRPVGAGKTLGRLLINTTVGVGGLFDPASKMKLPRAKEDLGQAFAVWGWDNSRYFVAPLQGPKTVRDFVSGFAEKPLNPTGYIENADVSMFVTLLRMGSMRAAALPMDKMRAEAVDEYALVRDAWMQKRQHQIAEKP